MLRIWGRTNSVNVKKAMWCVQELGLQYERIDAGMQFGVVNTPEYRKMNPTGLVPTIDDDGFVLWESHSIVRYLCAKHSAGNLWPTDLRARARAAGRTRPAGRAAPAARSARASSAALRSRSGCRPW